MRIGEIFEAAKMKVQTDAENSNSDLKLAALSGSFNTAKQVALDEVCSCINNFNIYSTKLVH